MTPFLDQCAAEDLTRLSALMSGFAARRMRTAELVSGLARIHPERFGAQDQKTEIDEANTLTFVAGLLADLAEQKKGEGTDNEP